jgi:hypothetical protein
MILKIRLEVFPASRFPRDGNLHPFPFRTNLGSLSRNLGDVDGFSRLAVWAA